MRLFIFISVICFVTGLAHKEKHCFDIIDSVHQEINCSRQGGMCTISSDCPQGLLTPQQGLCPKQRSRGVECCYGISVKETRCQKRGGECLEGYNPCKPPLIYQEATDCSENATCCILV